MMHVYGSFHLLLELPPDAASCELCVVSARGLECHCVCRDQDPAVGVVAVPNNSGVVSTDLPIVSAPLRYIKHNM
jgi:hypothetical protein